LASEFVLRAGTSDFDGASRPLMAYIDNETNAQELYGWFRIAFVLVILWFVFGPVWSVVFFRRAAPS
jgi:hypothetical protein